ncbi:MAG: FHA domain-containing protein [Planctomyces sp.]|nr:FHA domain-containing protein [Planctomyces sp.]
MTSQPGEDRPILLELLDSSTGIPQRSWRFPADARILIGRSEENDVVVSNPYVSRSHAYVERTATSWQVVSISSQQIVIDGKRVQQAVLADRMTLRLGAQGSVLRFGLQSGPADSARKTLSYQGDEFYLELDRTQLNQEVREIEEEDFFQRLASNLAELRRARDG